MQTRPFFPTMALAAALLAGCVVGPNYSPSADRQPDHYKGPQSAAPPAAADAGAHEWWKLFADPVLDDLVAQVNVSNQNLAASGAAYRQALAVVGQQRAAFFPAVSLAADATRQRGAARTGASEPTRVTGESDSFQASVGASWEIDLWGRLRRAYENARASAQASAADLAFARLSLQGQLATAYLQLREADEELRIVSESVSGYERSLQIAQNRYAVGMAARSDVAQAQNQLANAQADAEALALQRVQLENAIAALVGKPASEFGVAVLPEWRQEIPVVPAGLPSQLLQRRPDIVAAERRVAAASAAIGVQVAGYFPTLTLTGSFGFLSMSTATLFGSENASRSAAASLVGPLLDSGVTRARVAEARAAYDQALAEYRQAVLDALAEVENQMFAAASLARQNELRREASRAADEAERIAQNQYRAGSISFTDLFVVQATALAARRTLAESVLNRQTAAVSLVTALGGAW